MKIKQFEKPILAALRKDIDAALKTVGEKYGVNLHAGNASYNSQAATYKLAVTTLGDNGQVESIESKYFTQFAELYGFKKTDLHKIVKIQNRDFKITGLLKRGKNRILGVEVTTSKGFKLPEDSVKIALGYNVNLTKY